MYFIKYKEQELPIVIDFSVIKTITSKLNIKLTQFENIIESPEHTEKLFWEGLKRGAKIEGKELLIKESEVEDVLSDSYADFILIFNKCVLKMFTPSTDDSKKN